MIIIGLIHNSEDQKNNYQDEELWFNDEEDFDEEGSGPVLGPGGGLGEPTKASCTSVSTTSPQVCRLYQYVSVSVSVCCAICTCMCNVHARPSNVAHEMSRVP